MGSETAPGIEKVLDASGMPPINRSGCEVLEEKPVFSDRIGCRNFKASNASTNKNPVRFSHIHRL
jgi:hypothetical protein